MVSRTIVANRSSLFAYRERYGYHLGGGRDDHLVVGYYGNAGDRYRFRSAIDFPAIDWSGITALTSAILTLHHSTNVHIVPGGSPRLYVERAVSSWSPNAQRSAYDDPAGLYWTTQPTGYPGPASTAVGRAIKDPSGATITIDVTAIVRAWAPETVTGGGDEPQRGLLIRAPTDTDSSRNWEAYSAYPNVPSSSRPSLALTYETAPQNRPPGAPVLGARMSEDPPVVELSAVDPDAGDTLTSYDVQIKLDGVTGWTDLVYDGAELTDGITGWAVSSAYAGDALETGTRYRWRARVRDQDDAVSPWSASATFIADAGAWDAWDAWARYIIGELATPAPDRELGVMYPEGDEIRAVLTTDYRERWRIAATTREPQIDVTAGLFGMTFELEYPEVRVIATLGDFEPGPSAPPYEPPVFIGSLPAGWTQIPEARAIAAPDGSILFASYVDGTEGHVGIRSWDYATGEIIDEFIFRESLDVPPDTHDCPAILIRPDGRLVVAYAAHQGPTMYVRISTNALDVSAWGAEIELTTASEHTYPILVQRLEETDDPIYLWYRGESSRLRYYKSTDGGASWASPSGIIYDNGVLTYWKIVTDSAARIDVFASSGWPEYGGAASDLLHAYADDAWRATDGSAIGDPPHNAADYTLVRDGSAEPAWWTDAYVTDDGTPVGVYSFVTGADDSGYGYAIWRDGAWHTATILASCGHGIVDPAPVACLDRERPGLVHLVRWIDGTAELWRYATTDDGETWTGQAITSDSIYPNLYPVAVQGHPIGKVGILWMADGTYEGSEIGWSSRTKGII